MKKGPLKADVVKICSVVDFWQQGGRRVSSREDIGTDCEALNGMMDSSSGRKQGLAADRPSLCGPPRRRDAGQSVARRRVETASLADALIEHCLREANRRRPRCP